MHEFCIFCTGHAYNVQKELCCKQSVADHDSQNFDMCSNQLRQTQSTLEDSGGAKFVDIIGNMQEEFTFEVLQKKNGMSVSSASCSALTGHVDELRSFIRRCVPS